MKGFDPDNMEKNYDSIFANFTNRNFQAPWNKGITINIWKGDTTDNTIMCFAG